MIDAFVSKDWEDVQRIYREGIETGNATFETEAPGWDAWDRSRHGFCRWVARTVDGEILGWGTISPVSVRSVYAGVAEASVYVAKSARGQGVGKALLQALIDGAERHNIWTLQASVFPENCASLGLLKSLGFREVGLREKIACHLGRWRDTILLERRSKVITDL